MMGGNITGISELTRNFKRLDSELSNKVGARMVASGAGIIKKEAKSIAQSKGLKKSGALINNIVTKREKQVPIGIIQYNVGVRHGRSLGNGKKVIKYLVLGNRGRVITKRKNDPFYWHFLNFGTKYINATHYLELGLERKQQAAIDAMAIVLDKDLLKANR